jgi:cytochrome c biogenesis protein CcdA
VARLSSAKAATAVRIRSLPLNKKLPFYRQLYFFIMLTAQEEQFIAYWEKERTKKKSLFKYSLGLPLGVLVIALLFVNIMSGWDKRATAVLKSNTSYILVIVLASIGIVVFFVIFSSRFQWEQREQQYKELLAKKENDKPAAPGINQHL